MEIKKGAQEGKFIEFIYTSCADNTLFNDLSEFTKRDELRAYKEEFLVKYFAYSHSTNFDCTLETHLENYITEQNESFKVENYADEMLVSFKRMLKFVNDNGLIEDLTINRKNRLLAIFIGTNLAIQTKPELLASPVEVNLYTFAFKLDAQSSGFQSLSNNISLVKQLLLEA